MKHKKRAVIMGMAVLIWSAGAVAVGGGYLQPDGRTGENTVMVAEAKKSKSGSGDVQELDEAIKENTKQQERLQKKKKQAENVLEKLQKNKASVKKYMTILDKRTSGLEENIDDYTEKIKNAQTELEEIRKQLSLAQHKQEESYEVLRSRIKYMYEAGTQSYIEYLMSFNSISDLFSRAEYVAKVLRYDRNVVANYQNIATEIEVEQENQKSAMAHLNADRADLEMEKRELKDLENKKKEQMKVYSGKIQDAKDKAADYASQIAASEKELEDLLARQRADDGDAGMIYPTSGEYAWPLPVKGSISSRFGPRTAPTRGASTYHKGLDISVPAGTSVLAAKDGKVVIAQYSATAGNYIGISHGGGVYTYYMHNSRLLVKVGDTVKQGQVISKSGNTGVSTGPHLHFAVFAAGNYVNPEKYIKQPK